MPKSKSANPELSIYLGNASPEPQEMTDEERQRVEFMRQRFILMAQAKSFLESKFQLAKLLYEVFEQHLTIGENWNTPYRFPELFGAIQRKASDLIDNLPEVKLHATKDTAADFAIALQSTFEHCDRMTNSIREKIRVLYDTLFYGTGILFEGYSKLSRFITPLEEDSTSLQIPRSNKLQIALYDGLASERVDPRDFFVDETATVFYDETGIQGARDCFRRRIYPYSTFLDRFKDFKNVGSIVPSAWGSDSFGRGKQPYPKESQEQKTAQRYVTVYEYWNVELDMYALVANGVEIYYGANPFKHKKLPYVFYYNYRRDDSVWGVSETEILASFIYAEEEIINLQILDAKLALQPALAVSGDVMFNSEENELEPGAIFTLRGLNGGKIGDAIQPLRFGGISNDSFELQKRLEDKRIVATGDDIKALYMNPEQLATQTLSKREAAQKRVRSNVAQNTVESERNRTLLRISNIAQFYAEPYQNIDGRVEFRRIKVEGYNVRQANDESKPEFEQSYGATNYFTLNPAIIGEMNTIEVEVIDIEAAENLKAEEINDMMQFLNSVTSLVQYQPQIIQGMDIVGLLKQIAKKMDLDYYEVFPTPTNDDGGDEIDLMIDYVMVTGQVPDIDPMADNIKALERYREFLNTDTYKNCTKQVQSALLQLIQSTVNYVPQTIQNKLQAIRSARASSFQGTVANNAATPDQLSGLGNGAQPSPLPGGNVPPGGQPSSSPNVPAVQAPRGVGTRLGFRQVGAPQRVAPQSVGQAP